MDSTVAQPLKRTFEESGLGDGTATSGKGRKLNPDAQKASLDSLPTEILCHIASHLSTSELLSLRLTSRTIEVQLFNDFAAYYFAKKQFMLTTESLQCLLDISLHPKLSTVLQHVIISLDKYAMNMPLGNFHGDDIDTYVARSIKYRQRAYDQAVLLATGRDRELLAQAFGNLRHLKTVGLRDYNSGMRRRDGEGAEWRAYGATTVIRETGMRMLGARGSLIRQPNYAGVGTASTFAARTFTTVLHALGSSGTTPDCIEILLRDELRVLPDYAFHIPKFMEPAVTPLLAGLKTLLLAVGMNQGTMHTAAPIDMGPDEPGFAVHHFLSLVPNVTHLRLNFQSDDPGYTRWFWNWLAIADTDLGTQLLPKLTQLDFGMMRNADLDRLGRVVGRWGSTLTRVSFWKVTIKESDDQRAALQLDSQAKPNRWAELLVQLPKVAPKLRRITVGCLAQVCRDRVQHIALNVGSPPQHSRPPVSWDYRLDEMLDLKKFRSMLDTELKVLWPKDLSSDDSEHDGTDSEGDGSDSEQSDDGGEEGEEYICAA
ncbi:hypothetical protein CONLIGDRAFT_714766 [Coniochaeta ligniaria NRRL 30616]|uniref:F-box domain-containing protein n=1 Tax=Coniochaeta ligniaria NRRL 30616 TaxID=1408157 RepID=A0A1J7IL63_9PEZI|nr:hypothetical protein CONLIGDRAFT_714766 [Coniochaeta ligniaria NRRL 30616]